MLLSPETKLKQKSTFNRIEYASNSRITIIMYNTAKAIFAAITMAAALTIGSGQDVMGSPLDLSQFKWKNRLLLLFAPHRDHPFFDSLHQAMISRKGEVKDRDLIVFEMFEEGPSTVNGEDLNPQTALMLRVKYNIQPGEFTIILIGKDGGVKLNRREKTEIEDIFGLIDSMPMRQQEIRGKNQNP